MMIMMMMRKSGPAVMLAMALLTSGAAWSGEERAQHAGHDHTHHAAVSEAGKPLGVALKLPDTVLTDQNGRQLRLLSEVVADKVVLASFMYTTCTTICPVVSHLLSQVQQRLGSLLDSKVRLASLTVDPARDTPARLKTYSARHDAGPGWLWLSGPVANVTEALKGFGAYTANFENHPALIMIGDGRSGKWTRIYGFADPEMLVSKTQEYLAARDGNSAATERKE